jgi:hypothetical protein
MKDRQIQGQEPKDSHIKGAKTEPSPTEQIKEIKTRQCANSM